MSRALECVGGLTDVRCSSDATHCPYFTPRSSEALRDGPAAAVMAAAPPKLAVSAAELATHTRMRHCLAGGTLASSLLDPGSTAPRLKRRSPVSATRTVTEYGQQLTRSGVWGSLGRFAVGSNKLLNSELKRSANGSPLLWRLGLCLKLSVADLMVSADNSCDGACAPCRLRARDVACLSGRLWFCSFLCVYGVWESFCE